ncbi:MAG: beta-lactamase family protein [Chitinophagaceae bacterium]|nr:beta-lactamase family protein [Chitinophagaceae bacterium]
MKRLLILLLFPVAAYAQTLPDSITKKVDEIFKSFGPKTPGCSIAILKDGNVIFQKGYGMANLEYDIPIVPTTIFHIASESKQYVAFCMLLLEKEGKISLDDDIRKHLDFVPDFGHKITIRHLIHHTSGLRDQWQLLANAGWQLDDVITQDHVIRLISKQKTLNFIPGDQFMYCNTGYTLMAEIVRKVSGMSLRQFTDKNIFLPLEMKDTHFHDDYLELVPGRAYSYSRHPRGFQHAVLSYSIVGATSLFTTVVDELKWLKNFESGKVGGKDLIEKMYEVGVLNDGRKLNYAFAIAIDSRNGSKQIGHGGADAGYRTFAVRFPEHNLGIAVFSNLGSTNPTDLALRTADLMLPSDKAKPDAAATNTGTMVDSIKLKKLPGKYYSEDGIPATLVWENGKLMSRGGNQRNEWKLYEEKPNRYSLPQNKQTLVIDKVGDSVTEMTIIAPSSTTKFKRLPLKPQEINVSFAGRFYNSETEAYYTVALNKGNLVLQHRKFGEVAMQNVAPDQFTTPHWWMNHIRFIRNKAGNIIAFEVNSGRVLHLQFDRVTASQ